MGVAAAVVRPESTEQVVAVLAACRDAGAAVIPQGGNTGLVGGSVPRAVAEREQVVLSLSRMRDLEPVDAAAGEVTAEAGATCGRCRSTPGAGFGFGVDLGARQRDDRRHDRHQCRRHAGLPRTDAGAAGRDRAVTADGSCCVACRAW